MHLRASMPAAVVSSRGQMEVRIARKVAALAGIAGPEEGSDDAGRGHSWFSDYRSITTTELGLGGPVVADPPPAADAGVVDSGLFRRTRSGFELAADSAAQTQHAPIPSVTLRAYGPDTKAALVLTGVNRVLRPVTAAVEAALEDVRLQIADECLLVAVAQTLLQEVFEAQPLLILHGIQAGLIQRALQLSELVRPRSRDGAGPVAVSRVEYGWPQGEAPRTEPDQVALFWRTWDAVVADRPPDGEGARVKNGAFLSFLPPAGYEQDQSFVVVGGADAREEWVAVLRDLSESHLAGITPGLPQNTVWVSRTSGGRVRVSAMIPRERQLELMLARLAPRLRALGEPGGQVSGPRRIALPVLDVARWRDASTLQRRAVLLAHYYAIRAAGWLSGMKDLDRRRDRARCAGRYTALLRGAEELLAADDPLRHQLGAHCRGYILQYGACRGRLDDATYRRIVEDLDRLVELCGRGRYPEPQLLEQLQIVLVQLGTYRLARAWFGGEPAPGPTVTDDLRRLWATARSLRDDLITDRAERSYVDHDYAGFLLLSDPTSGSDVLEGLRMMADEIIPARAELAEREGRGRGLRLSRQVYLGGLATALNTGLGTAAQRSAWADAALRTATELEGDAEVLDLLKQRDPDLVDGFDNSVLILVLRIAEGPVAALTSAALPPGAVDGAVARTAAAVRRVEQYAREPRGSGPADLVDELRMQQVRELGRRWATWVESGR